MRAQLKKQLKPIGEKWLRKSLTVDDWNLESHSYHGDGSSSPNPLVSPQNQDLVGKGVIGGGGIFSKNQLGGNKEINTLRVVSPIIKPVNDKKESIIIETKKCRTEENTGRDNQMGLISSVVLDMGEDENMDMEQVSPNNSQLSKNGQEASIQGGTRLEL